MYLLKYTVAAGLIHTCINETHSLAPLQDLIPILWHHNVASGLNTVCQNLVEVLENVFHLCSYVATQLQLYT